MSVTRRFAGYSGIRVDIPHLRSIESSTSADFDSMLRGLVTGLGNPYLIRGFNINIPSNTVQPSALSIRVSDSALLHSSASESGTILTVPAGTPDDILSTANPKVVGAFQSGVPNYIGLDYIRAVDVSTIDQTAGWSVSQKLEYQSTTPIGNILNYQYVISTTGFGSYLPLYIVGVDSQGNVSYITKAVPSLFRLGTGGLVPNPQNLWTYGGLINPQTGDNREWINTHPSLTPNPMSVAPGDDPNAFSYGDFSITSLKDWLDAMMSRIRALTGSAYWYVDSSLMSSPPSTFDTWFDSVGSTLTGTGAVSYNMVLQATSPSSGAFQSVFTDPSILQGDSYVVGATSHSEGVLGSFNSAQLLVNSLTSQIFIPNEVLYNRRLYRPIPSLWQLSSFSDGTNTQALLQRTTGGNFSAPVSITSWSFVGELVTINATGHGYSNGQIVNISGLGVTAGANPPNGVWAVSNVIGPNSFQFIAAAPISGTPIVTSALTALDNQTVHPFAINSLLTVSGASPSVYNLTDVTQTVISPAALQYIIGPASMPTQPVATGPIELDGVVAVSTVADPVKIETLSNRGPNVFVRTFDPHGLSSGGPVTRPIYGDPTLSPFIQSYTGVNIQLITENILTVSQAGTLISVQTTAPHGLLTGETVQLAGITPDTNMDGTYQVNVTGSDTFQVTSLITQTVGPDTTGTVQNLNQFLIVGPGLPVASTYTNGGSDDVFLNSPNNPFPGPVQWSSDMVDKAIIGDLSFTIPQTATATGTPTANQFNTGGVTGTAFLQDGEVAYVVLQRNLSVSLGSIFSTTGGNNPIVGSTPPVDVNSQPLVVGDFVRFDGEVENRWLRIANIIGNDIYLITDRGLVPNISQRPAATGRLLYCKGSYPVVKVEPHWLVDDSADVYWLAVRRDNGSSNSKMYLRALELSQGEVRQINDGVDVNSLVYTGQGTEAAINPNYTLIDHSSNWRATQTLTVQADIVGPAIQEIVDTLTRSVTFAQAPALGFQQGDRFRAGAVNHTIQRVLTAVTVQCIEDVSDLTPGASVTYYRLNTQLNDSDNLTLALRKEDRAVGQINTELNRTVYDENVYVQQMVFTGGGAIVSGDYIYLGSANNPTGLAWVLHGTAATAEAIEGVSITMPGGHPSLPANSILVNIISGSFPDGSVPLQDGISTGLTVANPGNPPLVAPPIAGGSPGTGVELVLPPNKRTQQLGTGYVIWPAHSTYEASQDANLSGEDLLVVVNDGVRTASIDHTETFGGPKAKIMLLRSCPPNSRIRFRRQSSVGSALSSLASATSLQGAYNAGNSITATVGRPVALTDGSGSGSDILTLVGSETIDGRVGGIPVGGLFGAADQSFLIGEESNKPAQAWAALAAVKSHSGFSNSSWQRITAADTTTNNISKMMTGAATLIRANSVIRVQATVVMRDSVNGGSAAYRMEGLFKRSASNSNAVAVGSPSTDIIGQDGNGLTTAISFGLAISGLDPGYYDQAVIVLYGASSAVQYWVASMDYQAVSSTS